MPAGGVAAYVREGLAWLWHQPFLRAASLLVAGSNFLFQGVVLVLIVIARDHLPRLLHEPFSFRVHGRRTVRII